MKMEKKICFIGDKRTEQLLDPFIFLRRLKDEVLSEIPKKTEVTVIMDLQENDHKDAYNWTLNKYVATLR